MELLTLVLLLGIICGAHFVETVTGFGATVIALALAVHLLPVHELVITLVLLGWLQSAYLIGRGFRHIAWGVLLKRIVPLAGVGLAAGYYLYSVLDVPLLKKILGGFVIVVAAMELIRLIRNRSAQQRLPLPVEIGLLIGGGVFHGLFASGGPLIVYYASRVMGDKHVFRVTLSTLWIVLNSTLLVSYAVSGRLTWEPSKVALMLVPALVVGVVIGELLHRRINETLFRTVVQGVLLFTGVMLVV